MPRFYLVSLLVSFIGPLKPSVALADAMPPQAGGFGAVTLGFATDSQHEAQGQPSYGSGVAALSIGGSGGAFWRGLWVGGKGFLNIKAPQASPGGDAFILNGGGGLESGVALFLNGEQALIAYLGIGAQFFNQGDLNAASPYGEVALRYINFFLGRSRRMMLGLEAGYRVSFTSADWVSSTGRAEQFEDLQAHGIFVNLLFGGGGYDDVVAQ